MANRFFSPNQQFADNTGLPYAGGSLTFYASGTSTPLATYSDRALSIANTNPVVLDSAGRAGNVFLQNLSYKVVLSDVNSNVIWTEDPVYSSDFSTTASFLSGNGSPNGTQAGSAGTATIPASVYWDATNNILYVCTQTGTSSTAVWTAINAGAAAAVITPPQGYLTPTTGTPVINADVLGTTNLYYTPFIGNLVPIYNGTSFTPLTFSELILTLTNQTANAIYDVFVFSNSGVLTLAVGPAWTSAVGGSSVRGTGAGTTQLSRINGLWVNTVSMSASNGANTYTIAANLGTFLGSIFIDSIAGQITCHVSYGSLRKWAVSNAYNRMNIQVKSGDPTSYSYTTNAWRANRGGGSTVISIFSCLAEEPYDLTTSGYSVGVTTSGQSMGGSVGIGFNSTAAPVGRTGQYLNTNSTASNITFADEIVGQYFAAPSLGLNTVNALENGLGVTGAQNWSGGESFQVLTAKWRG